MLFLCVQQLINATALSCLLTLRSSSLNQTEGVEYIHTVVLLLLYLLSDAHSPEGLNGRLLVGRRSRGALGTPQDGRNQWVAIFLNDSTHDTYYLQVEVRSSFQNNVSFTFHHISSVSSVMCHLC